MMKRCRAFALLEVLLAVILIAILTVGSYGLVKSFRSSSSMQKLTRYSTTVAESYMPFLDGSVSAPLLSGSKLSADFLKSIHIPEDDLTACSNDGYCYVQTGLYTEKNTQIAMTFGTIADATSAANFFMIGFTEAISPKQRDQMLQSLGSVFSLYCPTSSCQLLERSGNDVAIKMVFPKAGSRIPS